PHEQCGSGPGDRRGPGEPRPPSRGGQMGAVPVHALGKVGIVHHPGAVRAFVLEALNWKGGPGVTRTPPQQTHPGLIRHGRAIWNFSAWAVSAIAAAGIAGWITDNHRLTSIHPGLVPINPLTALCFLAGAGSMVLIHRKGAGLSAARPLRRLSGRLALGMA